MSNCSHSLLPLFNVSAVIVEILLPVPSHSLVGTINRIMTNVNVYLQRDKTIVNDYDENSNAPLHLAALEGHTKVAAVLLEAGADIAARYESYKLPHILFHSNIHNINPGGIPIRMSYAYQSKLSLSHRSKLLLTSSSN